MHALDGLRVIDFSTAIAGPYIGRILADFGGEVIKVETIHAPGILRVSAPYKDKVSGVDRTFLFPKMNNNKYSLGLNLSHSRAQEIATRLMLWADVVIESFPQGKLKKWGLNYEEISKLKPDIILFSCTAFGQTGPFSTQPGYGYQVAALAGFIDITGWPDRQPVGPTGAYTDYVVPGFGVAAILAAVDYRKRTGKGQHIDMAQLECSLTFLAPALLDYTVNKRNQSRMGNWSPRSVPHNAYRCKGENRWCAIAVFNDDEWTALCEVVSHPEWTKDHKFSTFLGRKKNEQEIDHLIEAWTVNFTAEEVMNKMQAAGVHSGVVKNTRDIFEDEQLRNYRGLFPTIDHPVLGHHIPGVPTFTLSKTPFSQQRPAPCLGEHNEYVCREILHLKDEEIVDLLQSGVLE